MANDAYGVYDDNRWLIYGGAAVRTTRRNSRRRTAAARIEPNRYILYIFFLARRRTFLSCSRFLCGCARRKTARVITGLGHLRPAILSPSRRLYAEARAFFFSCRIASINHVPCRGGVGVWFFLPASFGSRTPPARLPAAVIIIRTCTHAPIGAGESRPVPPPALRLYNPGDREQQVVYLFLTRDVIAFRNRAGVVRTVTTTKKYPQSARSPEYCKFPIPLWIIVTGVSPAAVHFLKS